MDKAPPGREQAVHSVGEVSVPVGHRVNGISFHRGEGRVDIGGRAEPELHLRWRPRRCSGRRIGRFADVLKITAQGVGRVIARERSDNLAFAAARTAQHIDRKHLAQQPRPCDAAALESRCCGGARSNTSDWSRR